MLEKDILRKSDLISGLSIVALGLFIVSQAIRMPMKDSWGGVQNVWFVSPALFPLFVGAMLIFLGAALFVIGLRSIGREGVEEMLRAWRQGSLAVFLREPATCRFFAVVYALLLLVFVMVPRVDFFAGAVLFLLLLFAQFYCSSESGFVRLFRFSLGGGLLLVLFFVSGADQLISATVDHPGDWLTIGLTVVLAGYIFRSTRQREDLRRRYWLTLFMALLVPFAVGIIFKYFLLVPMPHEGLVVQFLDTLRYALK